MSPTAGTETGAHYSIMQAEPRSRTTYSPAFQLTMPRALRAYHPDRDEEADGKERAAGACVCLCGPTPALFAMEPEGGRAQEPGRGSPTASLPSGPREQERQRQQEKLSGVVKSVHRRLRKKYREVGDFDKIWREHCEDEETLCEYAEAMKNLADNHWAKTCEGEGRIEWCCSVSREYFQNGGKRKALEKDEKRAVLTAESVHPTSKIEDSSENSNHSSVTNESLHPSGKIRLLDVGSCFNPFLKFEEFLTVGIDIVPAVESVYKCDFLNLQIQQPLQLAQDAIDAFLKQLKNPIDSLPGELFHVVVFSLLLSYFPSPYQRWICCKKAHELLVLNGLLLIITPDSSHQNRHAMMMKSWKIAIESLGFKRFKYSKFSHMHLMAFRKISLKTTSDLVSRNYPGMLYIPQDFNNIEEEGFSNNSCYIRSDAEDEQLAYSFMELPDAPYDSDSGESQASSIPFYELEDPILLLS